MAYQIPAPQPMCTKGDVVSNWKSFQTAWAFYSQGIELGKKEKTVQVGVLCSVMGGDCLKIMESISTLTADDKKDPANILLALKTHFMPEPHVLFERYKFNIATQPENEQADQFLVRLRQLSETCEYGDLKDSLIRDRLVIGSHDQNSCDRLMREDRSQTSRGALKC